MKKEKLTAVQRDQKVLEVLTATISATPVTWSDIMAAVSAKVVIKNWLTEVRSVLQYMMNQGMVSRCPDVRHEQYVKC